MHRVASSCHAKRFQYPYGDLLHLQTALGNQVVQRLLKEGVLQAKLSTGWPNDIYEQETDRAADRVMRMLEPGMPPSEPEKDDEEMRLQTKPLSRQDALIQREEVLEDDERTKKTKRCRSRTKSSQARVPL